MIFLLFFGFLGALVLVDLVLSIRALRKTGNAKFKDYILVFIIMFFVTCLGAFLAWSVSDT